MNFVLPGYYWVCNVVFAIAVVSDWLNDLPVAFVALNGDATFSSLGFFILTPDIGASGVVSAPSSGIPLVWTPVSSKPLYSPPSLVSVGSRFCILFISLVEAFLVCSPTGLFWANKYLFYYWQKNEEC